MMSFPSHRYLQFVQHAEYQYIPEQAVNFYAQNSNNTSPISVFDSLGIAYTTSPSSMSDETPIDNLTPDEANRIIHSHRKVRYGLRPPPSFSKREYCLLDT